MEQIRIQIAAKASFIAGCEALSALVRADGVISDEGFVLVSRVASLLKARYTLDAYWKAGLELFLITASCANVSLQQKQKLGEWIEVANAAIDDSSPSTSSTRPEEENTPSLESTFSQFGGAAGLLSQLDGGEENVGDPLLLQQLLSDIIVGLGGGGGFRVEDDEIGPPPASRDARFNLPIQSVQGQPELCAICQDMLAVGSKGKALPCKHIFHPKCILDWLERHNNCPMCRHALPSEKRHFDDVRDKVKASRPSQLYT